MLEATLEAASTLKRLLDAIKDLVTDGNFDCNDEGISLQAMDNSHVALVSVHLRTSGFTQYRCDRPLTLGVNIASLTKVVKCAKDDDEVVLTATDTVDLLNLVYNAKTSDRVAEYSIKLMDIDQETLGIPETDYDAEVTMQSSEFARLCRDLSALGESVRIEVTKEGVRFSSEGDAANGSVLLKPGGGKAGDKKMKVKKEEEDEDAQMDEDASEDDGGANEEDEENEDEDEESSSKKRKRSRVSSEKARKPKKAKKSAGDDEKVEGIQLIMSQQVNLTFSLKYLQNFAKSSSLCANVTLKMSNEVPLLVAFDFGQGTVSYYLAPKIGDD